MCAPWVGRLTSPRSSRCSYELSIFGSPMCDFAQKMDVSVFKHLP